SVSRDPSRSFLRSDQYVADAVLTHELRGGRVSLEDLAVVILLLDVVGEPVRPQPAWIADELAATGERRDRTVVFACDGKDGGRVGVVPDPIRDLEAARIGEEHPALSEIGRPRQVKHS